MTVVKFEMGHVLVHTLCHVPLAITSECSFHLQERLSDAALEFCQSVGSTAKTTVDVIKGDPAVMAGIQVYFLPIDFMVEM